MEAPTKATDADAPAAKEEASPEAADASPSPSPEAAAAAPAAPAEAAEEEEAPAEQTTFPQQLMDVLDKESADDGASRDANGDRVFAWTDDGTAFVIRDKAKLEKEVLPGHFQTKCKSMSFIRKLYRWGFRQAEKQNSAVMTFSHANFVRGDKKRCLAMRSIVRKAQPRPQPDEAAALRAFGGMGGMNPNNFLQLQMQMMASQYGQFPMQQMFNAGMMGSNFGMMNGMSMPNQFAQGGNGNNAMASDLFQASMKLQEMEQRQQAQMYGNGGGSSSQGSGSVPEMELASEIMRRDPSMDPRRALELARSLSTK